jgi:hypothetical protein
MKRATPAWEQAALAALLAGAGVFVVLVRGRSGWDQDIWWHLAAGRWITDHRAVPATDPFSQFGDGKPWVAYSWLFEVIVYGAYQALGLRGIVLFAAIAGVLITATLYALLRRCGAPPTRALPLTLAAFYGVMPLTTPRPWLLSILFLLAELHMIVAARGGASRAIWWLPPIFVLWANVHIQFVVGLVVIAVAAAEAVWDGTAPEPTRDAERSRAALPVWLIAAVSCIAATLVNPYGVRVYVAARDVSMQTTLWSRIGELAAPAFRTSPDWVILALVVTAAGVVGWQVRDRPVRVFWLLMFGLGLWLGFRSRRDSWFVVSAAACIIASARVDDASDAMPSIIPASRTLLAAAIAGVVVFAGAQLLSETQLRANVGRSFPATAAASIDRANLPGPVYNFFDWGGFLMWQWPQRRVGMDGRTAVHGEERVVRQVDTWQGRPEWRADPELAAAGVVIGPRDLPLASLLRLDDRFTLFYEDPSGPAVVFRRR